MTFELRAARSTDAGKVGAILSDFVARTDWMPKLHTAAEDIGFAGKMIDRGWVRVAENQTGIVGFIARDGAEVNALYVNTPAQRSGIGAAFLDEAKAEMPNLELWTFQSNTPALAFYAAQGFHEVRRTDGAENDEKLPDVRLAWERDV